LLDIYIDADGCPVKDEVYKVAARYDLKVIVVANKIIFVPRSPKIELITVSGGFDAADDWIVEHALLNDIVITSDILLAERCLKNQARVLGAKGVEFTTDSIGSAVASRELMIHLRNMGEVRGGPSPMDKKSFSQFLSTLDQMIHAIKKTNLKIGLKKV